MESLIIEDSRIDASYIPYKDIDGSDITNWARIKDITTGNIGVVEFQACTDKKSTKPLKNDAILEYFVHEDKEKSHKGSNMRKTVIFLSKETYQVLK